MIKFGPAGLGGVKEAIGNLERYASLGLKSCEIAFTYGIYIKHKEDAVRIGNVSEKLGVELSIHAPYWINLNSREKEKIEQSKKRILDCCEIAYYLKAGRVVFHAGFYGKFEKEECFENIKIQINEMLAVIKEKKWNVKLCPEVMGKKNVFGSVEEIARLVRETGCGFCIDFAHVLARYGSYEFDLVKNKFPEKRWHCHFSGIDYGVMGEKKHKMAGISDWRKFLKGIPKDGDVNIICESPEPVKDCVFGQRVLNS